MGSDGRQVVPPETLQHLQKCAGREGGREEMMENRREEREGRGGKRERGE